MILGLQSLAAFFLRIGATGFGGPVAVTNKMRKTLVDELGILAAQDFREALTLAHLMPGPLAIQVAIYIGWKLRGVLGGTIAGICFVLPSFFMTVAIAWAYVKFSGIPQIQSAFHGVSATVAALILFNSSQLSRGLLGKDWLLWIIAVAAAGITLQKGSEPLVLFLTAGAVNALARSRTGAARAAPILLAGLTWFLAGDTGAMPVDTIDPGLPAIFGFFFKSGALIFGSGLVIIPFMREPLIHSLGWLTPQQFIDAVAVGFMTPGPALITVAFIGYLVHGFAGAIASSVGIFLPSWFYTLGAAPFYQRIIKMGAMEHVVAGISAAAVGAIAGAGIMIAQDAIRDLPTAMIGLVSLVVLVGARKVPEFVLIALAAITGILI